MRWGVLSNASADTKFSSCKRMKEGPHAGRQRRYSSFFMHVKVARSMRSIQARMCPNGLAPGMTEPFLDPRSKRQNGEEACFE